MGRLRPTASVLFLLAIAVGVALPAGASAAEIHAHRGGPNVEGKAMFGENSMSAFRHSAEAGFVVEFDLGRTADGVAVAMHDDKLDRTTDCSGATEDYTWTELGECRIDRIGTGDVREDLAPGDERLEPVPSLAQVIDLLKETGARANIEAKNIGSGTEFPDAVYAQLAASGLPSSQVVVQNFRSSSLESAPELYPGVTVSQLAISLGPELDQLLIDGAASRGAALVSPQWPIDAEFVTRAHDAGLLVAPWTINEEAEMLAAAGLGVDAVITDDPTMADRLVGPKPPDPPDPPEPEAKISMKLLRGKMKARPGGNLLLKVRITNSGDIASDPLPLNAYAMARPLRLLGKWPRTVAPVQPGQVRTIPLKIKVKRKTRKPGSFRVFVQLHIDATSPLVNRSLKVRVQRPKR